MFSLNIIEKIYNIVYILLYVAYFTAFINYQLFSYDMKDKLTPYITLFISLFLVARFNPFVNPRYTNFDKRIIFDAAIFLLISTSFTNGYLYFFTSFHQKLV